MAITLELADLVDLEAMDKYLSVWELAMSSVAVEQ